MVDLEKEREVFERLDPVIRAINWYGLVFSETKGFYVRCDKNGSYGTEGLNLSLDIYRLCERSKQAEIDSLKSENAALKEKLSAKASEGIVLNCSQLVECLEFGAPDLKIEQTEYSNDQMSHELSIGYCNDGHSGSGIYVHVLEYPEEGSIKLSREEVKEAEGG